MWGCFETWIGDDRLRQIDVAPVGDDGYTDHAVGVLKTLDGKRCWCSPRGEALAHGVVGVVHSAEDAGAPRGAGEGEAGA